MKNNMFENARFGKTYKTRDGRKAIYNYHSMGGYHDIVVDGEGMSYHFEDHTNGIINLPLPSDIEPDVNYSSPIDIVSEWQESIDEVELDKLAIEAYPEEYTEIPYCDMVDSIALRSAFKAGYRKAKEL